MLIVQKYGGTSVADKDRILAAAHRAARIRAAGHQVVMVVSAQGDTTDLLLRQAAAISAQPSPRETDTLISAGEQMSAALMAMALNSLGCRAVSLTGWQAGIRTDCVHGSARIHSVECARLRKLLHSGCIPVVAGFQGIDPAGDITTLGRGGSDTTAVALAVFLRADRCQIFTDVDGVYTRDPRKHPDARRYRRIGYDRMLRLIGSGAQVLHDRSVEMARDYGLTLEVLSAFTGAPGTLVTNQI